MEGGREGAIVVEARSVQWEANTGENSASACDAALKKGKVIDDYQSVYTVMVLNRFKSIQMAQNKGDFCFLRIKQQLRDDVFLLWRWFPVQNSERAT